MLASFEVRSFATKMAAATSSRIFRKQLRHHSDIVLSRRRVRLIVCSRSKRYIDHSHILRWAYSSRTDNCRVSMQSALLGKIADDAE